MRRQHRLRGAPAISRVHARSERFACIVAHRRAGKTVACVHDLQRGALLSQNLRPRFAYLSPFLRQSKQVAWDYLRAAMTSSRAIGASAHEMELRVDYPNGGQVRLFGAGNPDALRGIYLNGVVLGCVEGCSGVCNFQDNAKMHPVEQSR